MVIHFKKSESGERITKNIDPGAIVIGREVCVNCNRYYIDDVVLDLGEPSLIVSLKKL